MRHTQFYTACSVILCLVLSAGAGFALQQRIKLMVNDKVASTDVISVGGRLYVPVADMASALNLPVIKRNGNTIVLTNAGGANQAGDYSGKIGDDIFTGRWKFHVTSVEVADEYLQKFDTHKVKITPKTDGDTLIIVQCRLKNGTKEKQDVYLQSILPGYQTLSYGKTSLADDQEHSYTLYTHDANTDNGVTSAMLPGSAKEFALIFNVPRGTKPNDLVFTIMTPGGPDKHGTDIRVSLKAQ